jgi:hypothetical protein
MASHPDLPALQEQVHALRVRSAWKSFAGNDLPPAMQSYLNAHAISKRCVSPRRKQPTSKKPRLKHESDVLPVVLPRELESWGCNSTADGFRTTSFPSPLSFCTKGGSVKVSVCPLVDHRFAYKASFEITHDLKGRPTRAVKVVCPSLRTARNKLDVGDKARNSMSIIAFNMYVRIISRMRRNLFMDELDIDTELQFNPGCCIADAHIPDGVVQAYFPMEKNVCAVVQELCALNGIYYVNPDILFNEGSESSDSSSE